MPLMTLHDFWEIALSSSLESFARARDLALD
jgi:hypothetical protein